MSQSARYGLPDSRGFFGAYGGQYVPESVKARLDELSRALDAALEDTSFQRELEYLFVHYTGRPSPVFHCTNLSKRLGGAQIWLKREDLNHLGAHQDQQYPGSMPAGQADGQKAGYCRNRCGPARRGHGRGAAAHGPRVHNLHGRGGH